MLGSWDHEQNQCSKCGQPREVCSDHEARFYPQRSICFASMELAAAERKYDALHEAAPWHDGTFKNWSAQKSPDFPYGHRDGVQIWVADRDLAPDDRFLSGPEQQNENRDHNDDA